MAFVCLFDIQEFHQFGLRPGPIRDIMVIGPAARLVYFISACSDLAIREGPSRNLFDGRFCRFERGRFLINLNFSIGHFNSSWVTTKRRKLQNG